MNKKIIYFAVAAVLLLAAWYFIFGKKSAPSGDNQGQQKVATTTTATSSKTSGKIVAPVVKKTIAPPKTVAPLSATQRYLDALKIYKTSGYYFQFVSCHGAPGSLVLKKGKKFMLDNRDNQTRKIAIQGGQTFQITAYNFAIATAPSTIGTHYITCDGGGAASISVQP